MEAAAVRLLARREHSTEELRRKLERKGHPEAGVVAVVEKLTPKRLVSDDRFVASFVHHHAQRGQGPVRIRAELRQQGVADEHDRQGVRGRESGLGPAGGRGAAGASSAAPFRGALTERAKQARFLQYRGFSADQIRAALSFDSDEPPTSR